MRRYNEDFGSLDMDKSYVALFELLWYSQMPCFDIKGLTSKAKDELSFLKKCFWKEKPISCVAIFNQRPTDQGMCCSFNMEKADQILKKSRYTETISEMQYNDAESAFETKHPPRWYIHNNEPYPQVGRRKGLMLVIDGHSNKISAGTVKENFNGFIMSVDDKNKFPLLSHTSLISRPGHESNIKVDAIQVESKQETRKYDPKRRNCYFPDEYELEIHQNYSQLNCIFECKEEFAAKCLSTCNKPGEMCNCEASHNFTRKSLEKNESCVPWFYPTDDKKLRNICSPWNAQKFLGIIQTQVPKDQCRHCLPDCITTKYHTTMTYAELRECDESNLGGTNMLCNLVDGPLNPAPWMTTAQKELKSANQTIPWYLNTFSLHLLNDNRTPIFPNQRLKVGDEKNKANWIFPSQMKGDPTYDAFKKDIGIVNIFFGEERILKYVTLNRMSTLDFLSQIGGSLGLFMGISIISVIELIYWFTFRLFLNA